MLNDEKIDISFNVFDDANGGDPDTKSKTLNHYHYLLWNKPLPNGRILTLEKVGRTTFYLYHESALGNFLLSSDSIIHPYDYWKSMKHIIDLFDKKVINNFHITGATIGGYIVFPAKRIDEKPTINCIRGMHGLIKDRFDLTLESIRRWYIGETSPLYRHIERYKNFFNLFTNFKGYIDFFLLNDLVDDDYHIKFYLPFEDFEKTKPLPRTKEEYTVYMNQSLQFVRARNQRILSWINNN